MMYKRTMAISRHTIMLLFTFITIGPFYWMISTSLKQTENLIKMPPDLIPVPINFHYYVDVFTMVPMAQAILNSFLLTSAIVIGTLFFSSLAAFAFSKFRFKFRGLLFAIILSSLIVPQQASLIPMYVAFSKIHWVDTYWPLIVPAALLNGYAVFLIRQFMAGIPDDYIEAAKIDGSSAFKIYYSIMLPLCKPILATLALFTFIFHWNNYLSQLIYINSENKFTVPLLIATFRDSYKLDWGRLMAGATVSILPSTLFYFFSQKFFLEGITLSGVKG
jgi:multiple sugar transport system permease protein